MQFFIFLQYFLQFCSHPGSKLCEFICKDEDNEGDDGDDAVKVVVGILGIGKLSIGPVPRHHQLYIGAIIMLTITNIIVSFSPSVSTPSFIRLF